MPNFAHPAAQPPFHTQPPTDPERDESVLTCGNTRILKFTLIVQRMPNSEHCLPGNLCTGLYAVNTSGVMPTQVLSFVSKSLSSLAQADDHRAKAVLRAVRHLKC